MLTYCKARRLSFHHGLPFYQITCVGLLVSEEGRLSPSDAVVIWLAVIRAMDSEARNSYGSKSKRPR